MGCFRTVTLSNYKTVKSVLSSVAVADRPPFMKGITMFPEKDAGRPMRSMKL